MLLNFPIEVNGIFEVWGWVRQKDSTRQIDADPGHCH